MLESYFRSFSIGDTAINRIEKVLFASFIQDGGNPNQWANYEERHKLTEQIQSGILTSSLIPHKKLGRHITEQIFCCWKKLSSNLFYTDFRNQISRSANKNQRGWQRKERRQELDTSQTIYSY
jgi:hypothetical protein